MKTLVLPRSVLTFLFGSLFFVAATSYAYANPAMMQSSDPTAMAEASFAALDEDKNGIVSSEEFFKGFPNMRETAFAAIDRDDDKGITLVEWKAFYVGHSQDTANHAKMMEPAEEQEKAPADGEPDLVMPADAK